MEATPPKVSYLTLPHKSQLAILCLARLADPLAQTSIQSYMFYQIRSFDPSASDAQISTQAGILISAKTAAQVCTGMLWGRLADSGLGGRKLVLLIGLLSCCVTYLGYGLSKSVTAAVIWQVLGGALSSNVAITRCVVAELNPEKRFRTKALLLLPLFANAGNLIGPLVGGLLSSNAENASASAHPYLGPNLFVSAIYFVAAVGVLVGLEETLEGWNHAQETYLQRLWKRIAGYFAGKGALHHSYEAVGSEDPSSPLTTGPALESATPQSQFEKLPFWRMWTPNVLCTMLSHFIITGHLGTFTSLWAIFLSTPVGSTEQQQLPLKFNGGLGMLPRHVGFVMALLGAIGVVLQLIVYPVLQDRFGTLKIWRTSLLVFPVVYLFAPFPSLIASTSTNTTPVTTVLVWLSVGFVVALFIIGRTGVTPATTLLINDCTPHPSVRGTIHTAGTVIGNLSRSIFPVVALVIFGRGLEIGYVGLAFWSLFGLAVLAYLASAWVKEGSNGKEIVITDNRPRI
ncbi:hypothetical protein ANO11243_050100 [Dothideomycetidae sp. 11243]|nr:hypothetical protein ANO11243_050100 [fungal sp. No.11243]